MPLNHEVRIKTIFNLIIEFARAPLGFRAVWDRVNAGLQGETISRASVINFLEEMREAGVLKGEEKTGKGEHRWVYSPAMDGHQYKQYLAKTIIESLMRDFPEETKTALENLEP